MKGAIKISFPGRDNFTFENDYPKVIDYIKEELEDDISENDIIEIYSNTGIQITNQTVFNNLKESQDDLKLVVKVIDIREKERAEKERREKERLEKERLEKERLEKERLEKERLEKERLEKQKEIERVKKEKLEREKKNLNGILTKISSMIDLKLSEFNNKFEEYKKETNLKFEKLEKAINKQKEEEMKKISSFELKVNQVTQILIKLNQSKSSEKLEDKLSTFKKSFSENVTEIHRSLTSLPNEMKKVFSNNLVPVSQSINSNFNKLANRVKNKNYKVSSGFNEIQKTINILKHYKKHFDMPDNNPAFKLYNSDSNINPYEQEEQSFYTSYSNFNVGYQIVSQANKFKLANFMDSNISLVVKIINLGIEIPNKSSIMSMKKGIINIKKYEFNQPIHTNETPCAILKFDFDRNKNIVGKHTISFGLFQPNNILIKEMKYSFEIEK